jgi:hypothetical protein
VATITWHNAKINANQPLKDTWSTERITYSLVLQETIDQATFSYNLPSGGITSLTRGASATSGERAILNNRNFAINFNNNAPSIYIPANAVDYAARIRRSQGPANP